MVTKMCRREVVLYIVNVKPSLKRRQDETWVGANYIAGVVGHRNEGILLSTSKAVHIMKLCFHDMYY
jgi:hypothetical protein